MICRQGETSINEKYINGKMIHTDLGKVKYDM